MYRVNLDTFEGPMDLLLFFIRRDELDIYDIPIARIADEFLAYVRVLEVIDLDRAGDFIYVAALLINIKARMLLPRTDAVEDTEPIDPRRELVERLLEYLRFKEATEVLDRFHERRRERHTRPEALAELFPQDEREEWADASVFDLIRALQRVLAEAPSEPIHAVQRVDYTVEEQQAYILEVIRRQGRRGFVGLIKDRTKPFIIATFLAILELARRGSVVITIDDEPDDFFVSPGALAEGGNDEATMAYDEAA